MGATNPPKSCPGVPTYEELAAGQRVFRVHHVRHLANAMNATPQPVLGSGGRFDCLNGSYAYTYLGGSTGAAIAETLCRDLPLDGSPRLIPASAIHALVLTELTVTAPLRTLQLHGPGLSQVGQDTWLTKSLPRDYILTRHWAQTIRSWAPKAGGFAYRCRTDEDEMAWVLFTGPGVATHPALDPVPERSVPLDSPAGRILLRTALRTYNAVLSRD